MEKEEKLKSQQNQERLHKYEEMGLFVFRFILFGVQSYHKSMRETLVSFMEENQILFAKVENTPMEQYLLVSKMKELGTWDPCLASVDIGFLGVTITYVTLSCSQYLYKTFIH